MAPQPGTAQQRGQQQLEEMRQRQEAQAKELKRLNMFLEASNELSAFESAFRAKAESWMIAARNVGSAYSKAAAEHRNTLKRQKESDALTDQIMFSILAVASVGALSWLSSAIQKRGEKMIAAAQTRLAEAEKQLANARNISARSHLYKWKAQSVMIAEDRVKQLTVMPRPMGMIIEALEDTLQATADKALGNVAPQLAAEDLNEVSANPDVFQNQEENKVSKVKILAYNTFAGIRLEWKDKPIEYWQAYDAKTRARVHAEWLSEANTLAGDQDLLPVQEMADELERGFWKKYILEKHSHRDFGFFKTTESYDSVGSKVGKRLGELGVGKAIGVPVGGNVEVWVGLLVQWAINYQVKSLLKNAPKISAPVFRLP
jgi:hypothetical protein